MIVCFSSVFQRLLGKELLNQLIVHVLFVYNTGVTLTHISLASFCGTKVNSADPSQMLQRAASDQGLHCLLKECSTCNKILIKIKNITQQPLKIETDWSN